MHTHKLEFPDFEQHLDKEMTQQLKEWAAGIHESGEITKQHILVCTKEGEKRDGRNPTGDLGKRITNTKLDIHLSIISGFDGPFSERASCYEVASETYARKFSSNDFPFPLSPTSPTTWSNRLQFSHTNECDMDWH